MIKSKLSLSKKQLALFILGAILCTLLAVYIGFVFYFKSHFLLHTTVGSISCGGKTPTYVTELNKQAADDYLLTIYDRKGTEFHLRGLDFAYTYIPQGEEEKSLKAQNPFAWPLSLFTSYDYDIDASVTYDSSRLEACLDGLSLFSEDYIEAPQNARLSISVEEESCEIIPEVPGNIPLRPQILAEIVDALETGKRELHLSDACYQAPEVLSTDALLTENMALIDKYTNATIHYEIENVDENLTKGNILKMISFDENGKAFLDSTELERFVQYLATKYNTYGDVREFHTSSGDVVNIGGGDYGWVIAKVKEAEQIRADLEGGKPVSREPVYEQRALKSGPYDIGDTYVEIDYTKQHLWFYIEGELITESDIVTGNISLGRGSPDGIFKIVYKDRDTVLVGEDYASPVDFFMPFAYNVGLHDASWRSNFGGEIYKTSGSRGCVNVQREQVEIIFNTIEVGTPVIAYYREPMVLQNEVARISNAFSYVAPEQPAQPAQ